MERRKFLLGMGAVAAGGAAALSTGAFTSAQVERNVTATVVSDNNAYLSLEAIRPYSDIENGELVVTFNRLSANSEYSFADVFRVRNTGSNRLAVAAIADFSGISGIQAVNTYTDDRNHPAGLGMNPANFDDANADNDFAPRADDLRHLPRIDPGEEIEVGIDLKVNTLDQGEKGTGTITVKAIEPGGSFNR